MTQEQIQTHFKQAYSQSSWKQFLGEVFANARLLSTPETLTGINTAVAQQALKLGYISLNENGINREVAVYEVTLASGVVLERNRVGLRNLLRRYWKDIDAAFIVYHNPDNTKWRFTYVSELTGYDAEGEFIKVKTEPKRYTYVLGEGESTRTAAERFALLAKKGSNATLDDVKEAFSVEKLSKSFFDEYKRHYVLFCDYMVSKPSIRQAIFNGDEKAIRDFTKKLLGRIVFLYFIQKKGWLGVPVGSQWGQGNFNFLTKLFENHKNPDLFYSEILSRLFFDTLNTKRTNDEIELVKGQPSRIPFLNGGLFEEDDKKHRNLIFDAQLFRNLFDFFSQYNFTIYEDDPNDHTVAVDPEMLGHIFENLLEDNKDKGAFYTPKEIVHYMCQESLIEHLATWFEEKGYEVISYTGLNKPDQPQIFSVNQGRKGQLLLEVENTAASKQIDRLLIEKLLKKKLDDSDKKLVVQHSKEFEQALKSVKICDPAIGSGAFPMGLLHEIFTAKQTLWQFQHGNLVNFPASEVKLNIIQNSIYGVDIEKGAVDIARLRFWLSLIVDEPEPKALPNLDYKIVVGNSLVSKLDDEIIDIDWSVKGETQTEMYGNESALARKTILEKISREQKEFFNSESDKHKLAVDIRKLKIDLLITQFEQMVKTANMEHEPKTNNFKDKKKFVAALELYLKALKWKETIAKLKALKDKPEQPLNFFDWKLDFPEVMNESVASKVGFDIVIGNPPWVSMKGKHGLEESKRNNLDELMQKYKGNNYLPNLFEFFILLSLKLVKSNGVFSFIIPDRMGFNTAYTELRRNLLSNYYLMDIVYKWKFETVIADTMTFILKNKLLKDYSLGIKTRPENCKLYIRNTEILESELAEFRGFENELTQRLVGKIKQNSNPLSVLCKSTSGFGGKSDKITVVRTHKNQIEIVKGKSICKYGTLKKYFFDFKDEYLTGRTRDVNKLGTRQKVLLRKTGADLIATYDNEGIYPEQSLYFLYDFKFNPFYILAIVNSKLINWYYTNRLVTNEDSTPQLKNFDLDNFPIVVPTNNTVKSIETKVNTILTQKSQGKDTTALEQQIDNLVYRLYGLTYEEVKVVDPEFGLSREEYEGIVLE